VEDLVGQFGREVDTADLSADMPAQGLYLQGGPPSHLCGETSATVPGAPQRRLDHSAGWSLAARPRGPVSSSPAFAGMRANMKVESAAIARTSRKAGAKSFSAMVASPRSDTTISTASAPIATPLETESCCDTAASDVARLMRAGSTSAKPIVIALVNCSERKKPPANSTALISRTGVDAVNRPQAATSAEAVMAL